jgi:hypothetical protein
MLQYTWSPEEEKVNNYVGATSTILSLVEGLVSLYKKSRKKTYYWSMAFSPKMPRASFGKTGILLKRKNRNDN